MKKNEPSCTKIFVENNKGKTCLKYSFMILMNEIEQMYQIEKRTDVQSEPRSCTCAIGAMLGVTVPSAADWCMGLSVPSIA